MVELSELSLKDRLATGYLKRKTAGIHLEPQLVAEYQTALPQLKELFSKTTVWHGTGRYQHGEHGRISDTLQGIVSSNGLEPRLDTWDFVQGSMQSISLAPSRMYSRAYAMRFLPEEEQLQNLYGRKIWLRYVAATTASSFFKDIIGKGVYRQRKELIKNAKMWVAKTTEKQVSPIEAIWKFFSQRSDIPGNYPILFGIQKDTLTPAEIASYLRKHELRTRHPIPTDQFTHVEVPYKNIDETKAIVGADLPVIPIEFAEEYCKGFSFVTLAKGGSLGNNLTNAEGLVQ